MESKVKLTKNQKRAVEEVSHYGTLYCGYNSPSVMRTFEILVKKGILKVYAIGQYGKTYTMNE